MADAGNAYWTEMTPLSFIVRSSGVYADKTAIVYGDRRFTYAEFGARVNRLASALKAAGLKPGERVGFLAPNIPPMIEAHFGVLLAGGVLVAINYRLAPKEIEYILNHSGATFLFVDTELSSLITPIQADLETVRTIVAIKDIDQGEALGETEYEAFLDTGSQDPMPLDITDEMDIICINYTSGTTGRPKGVMFTHRGAYINALGEVIETRMTPDSVYLWTLPMFHCNGWCFIWGLTAIGGTHVCFRKYEPQSAWDLVQAHDVTHFNGAPVVLIGMINAPNRPQILATPLTVTTGGAPPSPTLIEQYQAIGATLVHIYGLTETYGPYTICAPRTAWGSLTPEDRGRKMARQGVPYSIGDGLRVVDDDMNDVPKDGATMGEVVMRGNMVMKGYYNDEAATKKAFRGGWFHSGDLAVWHPDGYIELRDRSKDIIISGGENISSIEVEQALYRHPAILEVAVIGIPHKKWGETPRAYVTLKETAHAEEAELIEFTRTQIAHYKCPTQIQFGPLPKTSTGKIQKFVLRDKAWEGKEKRIQG